MQLLIQNRLISRVPGGATHAACAVGVASAAGGASAARTAGAADRDGIFAGACAGVIGAPPATHPATTPTPASAPRRFLQLQHHGEMVRPCNRQQRPGACAAARPAHADRGCPKPAAAVPPCHTQWPAASARPVAATATAPRSRHWSAAAFRSDTYPDRTQLEHTGNRQPRPHRRMSQRHRGQVPARRPAGKHDWPGNAVARPLRRQPVQRGINFRHDSVSEASGASV